MEANYQDYLLAELEGRKTRNPRYSLRSYARDLGLAAPKLSEILRGKCGLSEASAKKLVPRLGLSPEEAEIFIQLVIAKHSRSPRERAEAQRRLEERKTASPFEDLSLETFKVISEWQHFAILELCELKDFESDPKWIAARLGLSLSVTKESIQRLLDVGLLKELKNGSLKQTHALLSTPSGIPSAELRKHHRQILAKAEESLTTTPLTQRDLTSATVAIPESKLSFFRDEIRKFQVRLAAELAKSNEPKERVYCLSIQFFPLDRK